MADRSQNFSTSLFCRKARKPKNPYPCIGQYRQDLSRVGRIESWGSSGGLPHPTGAQRHKTGELVNSRKLDPVLTFVKATRAAAHRHATKMETFSWHNLKLIYAMEYGTMQTAGIFAILTPAIFTSVSLCALSF